MTTRVLRISLVALAMAGSLTAATAAAQPGDPEGGDVWMPPQENPPPVNNNPPQQNNNNNQQGHSQPWYQNGQSTSAPSHSVANSPVNTVEEYDNHERVVHRFAIGWMGVSHVPIADIGDLDAPNTMLPPTAGGTASPNPPPGAGPAQTGIAPAAVPTVALGIRYWFIDLVGLDVGLGFGYFAGNVSDRRICAGMGSCPTSDAFGLTIHGGVPVSFFHETHYSFLVIPELNLGFSTGTIRVNNDSNSDIGQNGFMFEIGGRLGTEVHFGFINIPSLSLQATVGLYFRYRSASATPRGADTLSTTAYDLATTIRDGEPWDIFTGSLTALYYF